MAFSHSIYIRTVKVLELVVCFAKLVLRTYCPNIYTVKKWVFFITAASIQSLDGPYGISFSIQAALNLVIHTFSS